MSEGLKPGRSTSLEKWFCEYESDHQNKYNKWTHYVGIPMIILGAIALLRRLALGPTNIALAVIALIAVFYIYHDRKLGLLSALAFFGLYIFSFGLSSTNAWVLFLAGWALQFIGHFKFEKRSPAFFKNLLQLLVGPIWILGKVTKLR